MQGRPMRSLKHLKIQVYLKMKNMLRTLDSVIYWLIILIPFSMAISPAPMNVFMGLLIISFMAKKILKRERVFCSTQVNMPLLFLFIVTCLSVFNSIDLRDSFKGGILRLLQYILIFFIMVEELQDKRHIKKVVFSMCLGVILASFDSIWQVMTGYDFIRGYRPVINIGLVRATASFKDPNTLGIYLSAIVPLICGLTFYYFKGINKAVIWLIALLGLAAALLTYSRPTLLAIYASLFVLGWVKRDKTLVAVLVIGLLAAPFVAPKPVKDWAREVGYNPLRFMCNDDRIAAYRNSLNMIKAHPLIGVGINTFMKNYKQYKQYPEYRNVVTADYLYAHNNFLHLAAEIGLIGLGVFIWLLYRLFRECAKIYKHLDDNFLKLISLSLTGCLIAFLVNGLTESSLYYSRVAVIFWYLTGFSLALNKFIHADTGRGS